MLLAKRWLNAWIYFVCIWELAAGSRPQFDTSTNMGLVLVPADAEVDSVIFRLRATDQDADFPLVFDITAAVQPIVRIENLPCTLYNKVCQANVILTRRLVPGRLHDFAVRVKDSKGDSNSMQATISVTNASTPRDMIFPHVPSIIMVPEDTKPGKELDYLLVRANPWQGKPVYIELWQPKELFTIRQRQTPTQTRGVITLIGELDFETQSMYTLTMYATDPYTEPGKDTRNIAGVHVVVIVQDVQDVPPVFTIAPPLTRVNNSVKPGDVILRVHAEDGDKGTPREVTYGLVSDGNPLTPFFNISEWTGEITLARPLDELTQITHVGAPILLTVVAEEVRRLRDEPPAQATVVELGLLLGEPGNSPPYFESDSYMAWMDENATPGTIVMFDKPYLTTVRDEDIGKTGVFALKLGNNNGTFEVTPTVAERVANFVVTVRDNALMDFEARKTVEFTIIAQEVGPATNLSTSVPVTVFLKDINDNPPEFEKDVYEVTLIENVSPKTRVVQVHATDKDTGLSGSVRYTGIIGPGNETLTMDSETGLIVVADGSPGLDREVTASLRLFVEARDENGRGLSSTVPLIVNLLDVNDNAPIFDKPIYEFILNSEQTNFTSPAFIRAVDADAEPPNNEVRYELMHGNYGNKFRLNEVTGELTLREPLTKSRRRRNNDYVTFATKFKSNLLQTLNMYQQIGSSTEKPLRIWKNRKKRAAEDVVYTLTVRAYDLGVPHLSSTAKVYIINATPMGALTLMLVVPAKDLDPLHTTEILAAITGGRVTIQDIRPYDQPGQPKNATSQGEKMSIVVARVEPTMSGTFLVDIEKIHKSLVANGMNIVPVTDSKTDSSKVENTPPDVGSSVTNPIGNSVVNPVGSISGRNNGSNSGRVQGNVASTGSGRGGENTVGSIGEGSTGSGNRGENTVVGMGGGNTGSGKEGENTVGGMGGGSTGTGKGGENTVGGMGGGSTDSGKGVENTGVGLSGGSTGKGKGGENTVVGLSGSSTSNGKGGENNIGGIGGGSTGSGNRGGNTMDGIGGSSAGNTGEGTIVKTSLGTYESSGGKSNIDTVNKTTLASNNEYIVYKAENTLLLWLLILLGLLMLLALLGLILCCICPGCPFYMAPRKRRVHSLETVNYVEGRPKRHLRRKQENVAKAEWSEKKQAWSADPMRHNWQFNRRNTKNRGIASLPGDVAEVRTLQGASKAPSFRMKDGPPSWRVQDMTQKRQDERLYVEDVETGQTYDIGDVDSLRRHEMERGSDVLRRSYHPADESLQFPREQQFYRDGNAEVLRLITRGHEKDDDVSPQAQRPITLVLDQQALGYRTDGKDILLRRFMEDQRIRQQQDIHGSVQEISVDALEPGKQGSGQFVQKHEVLLVPGSLEPDRRQQRGEKSPSVQCLIIDHGDLEDEEELKVRKQQIESKEAELQQQRKVAAAMLVGTAVAKATENAEQHGSFLNIPSYASQHAELAKQNALLTQLVMDRDARTLRVSGIDPGNYLETQSLPGQVAIATQTDRTAATQTDHFTQVRSRSDNDESDDEVRSRRKSKSKKRFGSELRRSRSLLMRSPIQEEARSSSDTRTNLLRRKAKDTREGRRATLEPEVLREISDSLDEHASTPSLEERRVENTESREMKNVDYKSDERADLNGEELSEIPRQSSPDAGKNKYHKRSHANVAVEDTLETHKLESKTKKQPSPTKSKVKLPKTEIKSVSSKKSDKKESDTTSSTKSISKRKSTESQSSSSGTEKNKKVSEDKKKSQSKSGPKPVMLKTTSEKPNKKSKPREPEEVPIAKKRTLLRQLKAKKMSTESSEVEELPDRSRHSSLKTKKSKHDPTKAKGINVLSDEPKSRSSETDRSQLPPRHQQSDSSSSTETTEQHDITAGEKKTSISSKVKEIKQDGQKNKIVQDSQTQKTQSETQPRQEVRKDPGSPEISKKLTTDAVQTMEMVSDPHQITGKENSNKPNGLNSKLDSDAGKLSTVSKEGQRKPTTYDDVGKVGVGSQSESGKLSPTLIFETLKSDANGKIETEPAEPSADEGSKTIDKISDESKEPEVKISESKVNTVIEKQLEPGSEKLSESDDKISRYLGEAVPIIVANNSKVDKISSSTEKGLKPSTTGTQGITEETSVEPDKGRPDLSELAVNVAPVEKQPDSTIKDSPMADEDSQKITADALPKSASQTVETDIDTFSKEKPKSIPKEMIKMFLESEAVHSARNLLQSFVKTESHPVPSSEKSLKPDINDALIVELSQEARTHQDTPGDENSAEKIKGDGEIGPIEASTSSADQIREKNDDAKSNLVDSTTLAIATTSGQINKIEDANKTTGGNPEKAPNETSLLNNASISPPDVARSETKRPDITRSEVDPPQMEQKSESPKRDKNELEKLESTDITNESSIAGLVGNIESSKTDKSLLPTDNSNDKSENQMIAATKKEKEIEVDQHSFPTVSDTKDNDMKSPEQNLAQVSNASDIPERESPSFYVLSGTSSPEGLDSKQEIRDKEIASDESPPEKTAAVPASSISELLTATEKREKVNIEPSKMQGQPLNSAKIQSQEWYKQLQTGDTSSDFSEVTQPYQTPRHRSKNRDGNGEESASVGIPAITAQLLDEGNDIPQAEHTRSTDKRPDSKKNDSKIQMRDETPGAFAPDNRDDELTPRLIAEEAIRSGLEELIATSGAPKMEKQSSKQPSSKASPENERAETSKRKSTKDTGRTPSSVESKKSVKERTGNGSQPIKKNAESQETTKLRRPKTEPKGGSQLEEDKHLQVRPRTQRGKPSDPRQEPTIQRSKPQERGGGDQARRNAEEAKSEESDQSKPAETKTGYMSRYKQKREEMERRRKELKEAAEEEQRPRWQRKPQRAPGKEAPRIKDVPQEAKTPEGATPRTRRRIKPLVNAESEQLRAMVKEGRKLRKAEGGDSDDPPVEIFASEPPRRTSPSHRPSHQQSSYKYEKVQPPFYLHPPPPVPHPSPQVSPLHGAQDSKRPDDDLDSGIAVSLQGGTKLRHQQLLEKKSVFDIAYSEAAPSQLRTDSTTPPS